MPEDKKPVVLIVDNNKTLQEFWGLTLTDKFDVFTADLETIDNTLSLFDDINKVDIIVMGTCKPIGLTDWDVKTIKLTKRLVQQSFTGPIIPMSSVPDFVDKLVEAGCTNKFIVQDKGKLKEILNEVLKTLY